MSSGKEQTPQVPAPIHGAQPPLIAEDELVKISLTASDDRLKLFLAAEPKSGGGFITTARLFKLLATLGISEGIDEGVLSDVVLHLARGEKVEHRRIKKGIAAEHGKDGKLLVLVKPYRGTTGIHATEGDTRSLTSLHLFDNITNEMEVARLYAPSMGTHGKDVFGVDLVATPGVAVAMEWDEESLISKQNDAGTHLSLFSKKEGYLAREGARFSVHSELVIGEDVGYQTGNIDFIGNVTIKGNIPSGFRVAARKGLVVHGEVREAILESRDGGIEIKGYCYGGKKGKVVCSGDFLVWCAQELHAEIVGDVVIGKECLDCHFRVQGKIRGEKGRLVGGFNQSVAGIELKELGNEAGTHTEVQVASRGLISSEYAQLVVLIENHQKIMELLELHLGPFARMPSKIKDIKNEQHRTKLEQLYAKLENVRESLRSLLKKQKNIREGGAERSQAEILFKSICHSGVKVSVEDKALEVSDPITGPACFALDEEGKIVVRKGEGVGKKEGVTGGKLPPEKKS